VNENLDLFREVIDKTLESLPQELKEQIKNLEFIVLEAPTESFVESHGFKWTDPFGALCWCSPDKRGVNYNWVLPDRIYIFMNPIIYFANLEGIAIEEKIRKVALHEIGHYFGMGEDDLRRLGVY